jgi:hydrogenase/urease accessory protein HupE
MKSITRTLLLLLTALPAMAYAHEGHHEGMSASVGLRHMLTEPDHLAMIGLFAILAVFAGWRVYRSRAAR